MDADGRKRKTTVGEVLLFPLILLNKGLEALLGAALGNKFGKVSEDDILSMVDAGNENGTIEDTSVEMINNIFEFNDLTASDVMTHRVNIEGVDVSESLDNLIYLALDKGFSRIPIFDGTIDRILGIILVKDLLCLVGKSDLNGFSVRDFLREVVFIPESCSCADTFKYLTNLKSGLAVVVDEYGGTAGIVTLEDLIESVMGNIQDEYDEEDTLIKKIGNEKYEIDGEADPDDVLELFGYSLPEEHEYDTIAGLVTDLIGHIPEQGEENAHVDYNDICFIVSEIGDNRINRLVAVRKEDKDAKDKK